MGDPFHTQRAESGTATSYASLFAERGITRIKIPLFQRDYAQGREDTSGNVEAIRSSFVRALREALTPHSPAFGMDSRTADALDLDFIYGTMEEDGTFLPLDGQQRLTTLFLLHWFLGVRAARDLSRENCLHFTYETRSSSRAFCQELVRSENLPPQNTPALADWIRDQSWFHYGWESDPTISSMLTMIKAIEREFDPQGRTLEPGEASGQWERLAGVGAMAVTFHLHVVDDLRDVNTLYITMNARGRALTEFENFKAHLLGILQRVRGLDKTRVEEFSRRIDTTWSNIFWHLVRDSDSLGEALMKYFTFVLTNLHWKRIGEIPPNDVSVLAERVFQEGVAGRERSFEELFAAFEIWEERGKCPQDEVASSQDKLRRGGTLFRSPLNAGQQVALASEKECLKGQPSAPPVALFDTNNVKNEGDLLKEFISDNPPRIALRLLLSAIIEYRTANPAVPTTEDGGFGLVELRRRMRILRNLLEASKNELRTNKYGEFLEETTRLFCEGTLQTSARTVFNTYQHEEELEKQAFLSAHPECEGALCDLEDHKCLRGGLRMFSLSEDLPRRAGAFYEVFSSTEKRASFAQAWLATADYSRRYKGNAFQIAPPENDDMWRKLLTQDSRSDRAGARTAFESVLDEAAAGACIDDVARRRVGEYLEKSRAEGCYRWPYYLLAYDCMREGSAGIFRTPHGHMGYELKMLERDNQTTRYRDPYLDAIADSLCSTEYRDYLDENPYESGGGWSPRFLRLKRSRIGIASINGGLLVDVGDAPRSSAVLEVLKSFQGEKEAKGERYLFLRLAKACDCDRDECTLRWVENNETKYVDGEDRIECAVAFIKALIAAGSEEQAVSAR